MRPCWRAPACLAGYRKAEVHWEGHAQWFSPRAKAAVKGGDDATAATARTELRRHNIAPPQRFHRGIVSGSVVDTVAIGSCRTELPSPGHVVGPVHPGDAHPLGRHKTQCFEANRRSSSSRVRTPLYLLTGV